MNRKEVFKALEERGAAKADIYFYGGNDEGHVESISLKNKSGVDVLQPFALTRAMSLAKH